MRSLLISGLVVLAGCGSQHPAPECDPNPLFADSALTCDEAVAAAVSSLGEDHPAIERVQFLFGSATPYFPALLGQREEQPVDAYVVFTFSEGSEQQYVPVVWWRDALSVRSPAEY
ncbi:MAG: hypothetical protein ABIW50_05680 [Candidatus Limnocylindria bacterium]